MADISPAQQAYLEAIYRLEKAGRAGRVGDIAEEVGVHKSSATGALQRLRDRDLVEYAPYEAASLTGKGESVAKQVFAQRIVIRDFLCDVLGVEVEKADSAASDLRHGASGEVVGKLACFLAYCRLEDGQGEALSGYHRFLRRALEEKDCEQWVTEYLERREEEAEEAGDKGGSSCSISEVTVERGLRGMAGLFVGISAALAALHSPWWLLFAGFVSLNLLQSAFTDWCPMMWLLSRLGFRKCRP